MEEFWQEVQEKIKRRAQSYTPEWRYDMGNPDIGSVLAVIYSNLMTGTMKRVAKIPTKNKTAFLNELGASVSPAVPSQGYVQFSLINEEVEGDEVRAGTLVMSSDDSTPKGQILFETQEDVYVTPAVLSDVYQSCDQNDTIYELYDREKGEWSPCSLFAFHPKNLQEHELYFSHDILLDIQAEGWVELSLYDQKNNLPGQELLAILSDETKAVFEYHSAKGWQEFEEWQREDGRLLFRKGKTQPSFQEKELAGESSYWMRLRILDYKVFPAMYLRSVRLSAWNREVLPEVIFGAEEECDLRRYLPFGERLELYQEVYFGSGEVLSRKGAQITFSFGIEYVKIPLDTNTVDSFQWEWIMKQSDFRQEPEFDITIRSVMWEYYNGSGWTRLFPDDRYDKVFTSSHTTYVTLKFICPEDIEKVLVNAVETYYVRARIMKINNQYKMRGNYVVPRLENTSFCYRYENRPEAQRYVFRNNLDYQFRTEKNPGCRPFFQTGMEETGIYLGFQIPPVGSPVKMLLCITSDQPQRRYPLNWSYWQGRHWKEFSVADGTEGFSKTGLVTFSGNPDIQQKRIFGKKRYWIRISTTNVESTTAGSRYLVLDRICFNVTPARNISGKEREYFQMEAFQEGKSFPLLGRDIYQTEVYVDEKRYLSEEERQKLAETGLVWTEMKDGERMDKIWVKWNLVPDFSGSGPLDRHYMLDRLNGELFFGNGIHGRVPYSSREDNICIDYRWGGGSHTNLKPGIVDQMERSIGYISGVTNPEPMSGGCDAETLEDAIRRNSAQIRHQGRAVSARDYEELVLCAAREVQMVKCFAGYDDLGKRHRGAVTLVVLLQQFRDSPEIREKILRYMRERISPVMRDSHKIFVVSPEIIEIRLYMELSVERYDQVFQVKEEILRRLSNFFRPVGREGRQSGGQIGRFPGILQIQSAVSDIRGIICIHKIMMKAYTAGVVKKEEVELERVRTHRYVLPVNGKHEIVFR